MGIKPTFPIREIINPKTGKITYVINLEPQYSPSGKRKRQQFTGKGAKSRAKAFQSKLKKAHSKHGENFIIFSDGEYESIKELKRLSKETKIKESEIINEAIEILKIKKSSITLEKYKADGIQAMFNRGLKKLTIEGIERVATKFIDYMGKKTLLCDITPEKIENYLIANKQWNNKSKNSIKSDIQTFLAGHWLRDKKNNPATGVVTFKQQSKKITASIEALDEFAWHLHKNIPVYSKDGTINNIRLCLLLQLFTTMGESEVRRGMYKDIELSQIGGTATITIRGEKTDDRERKNTILANHFKFFEPYIHLIESRSEEYFYTPAPLKEGEDDTNAGRAKYGEERRSIVKNTNLLINTKYPKWTNSFLRKTYGSMLHASGRTLTEMREILGHSFTSTVAVKKYLNMKVKEVDGLKFLEIGSSNWFDSKDQKTDTTTKYA